MKERAMNSNDRLRQTMASRSWSPRDWFNEGQRPDLDEHRSGIMHVYRQTEPGLWTVGYYTPDREWVPESDWPTQEEAANRVHWLNGGNL